jgi:hypothetical protein
MAAVVAVAVTVRDISRPSASNAGSRIRAAGAARKPMRLAGLGGATSGRGVCPAGVRATLAVKRAAGYSADMTVWQYAQLRVTHEDRLAASDNWTIAWYGPDATTQDTAEVYSDVVAELNRAGTLGWELVEVAAMDAGDSRHLSGERDWSLTRYTFRRPQDLTAVEGAEPIQQGESPRSQPISTGQPEHVRGDALAGSMTAEPGTLVTLTAYWLPDREPADWAAEGRDPGSAPGRLLISRKTTPLQSQAGLDLVESFRLRYEAPDITPERRERIKDAAADYAASWIEGQFGVTWWQTPQHLLLSQAADVLDGSAEWLRGLVEYPLAPAASMAGAAGPLVDIGAGITANLVTAPLTAPLEDTARACEIAGIVIGLATGAHPVVIACAHRLVHDEVGHLLSKGFEQVLTSIGADHDPNADPLPRFADLPRRPEISQLTLDAAAAANDRQAESLWGRWGKGELPLPSTRPPEPPAPEPLGPSGPGV